MFERSTYIEDRELVISKRWNMSRLKVKLLRRLDDSPYFIIQPDKFVGISENCVNKNICHPIKICKSVGNKKFLWTQSLINISLLNNTNFHLNKIHHLAADKIAIIIHALSKTYLAATSTARSGILILVITFILNTRISSMLKNLLTTSYLKTLKNTIH